MWSILSLNSPQWWQSFSVILSLLHYQLFVSRQCSFWWQQDNLTLAFWSGTLQVRWDFKSEILQLPLENFPAHCFQPVGREREQKMLGLKLWIFQIVAYLETSSRPLTSSICFWWRFSAFLLPLFWRSGPENDCPPPLQKWRCIASPSPDHEDKLMQRPILYIVPAWLINVVCISPAFFLLGENCKMAKFCVASLKKNPIGNTLFKRTQALQQTLVHVWPLPACSTGSGKNLIGPLWKRHNHCLWAVLRDEHVKHSIWQVIIWSRNQKMVSTYLHNHSKGTPPLFCSPCMLTTFPFCAFKSVCSHLFHCCGTSCPSFLT